MLDGTVGADVPLLRLPRAEWLCGSVAAPLSWCGAGR